MHWIQDCNKPKHHALEVFPCEQCGKQYKTKNSMKAHKSLDCAKPLRCDKCKKSYKLKSSLYTHQKYECGKSKSFGCSNCKKLFWHKHSLREHISKKRCRLLNIEKFKKNRNNPNLIQTTSTNIENQHANLPSTSRDQDQPEIFPTESCQNDQEQEDVWLREREEGASINECGGNECAGCGKRYKHKSHLRRHVKYECGKNPSFFCPYCQFRARRKDYFREHLIRAHSVDHYNSIKHTF
ncbi:zinc finger protein 39-like [Sitophilus oryzae]|uniref:Zinc finger protein 39-like n=1 Tax=Sitophilus oryzae TaxID=7048 RepID=A0A6J2YR72_SITOR|nr:zinc finger protein 39-like [Sitophilus oryzae]